MKVWSGLWWFHDSPSTIATAAHASASVALLFFLFEQWECDVYWWIFVICRSVHSCACIPPKRFIFFPDRRFTQHWQSTAAHQSPCLSMYFRSGNAGRIGLFLPSAGLCVWVCVSVTEKTRMQAQTSKGMYLCIYNGCEGLTCSLSVFLSLQCAPCICGVSSLYCRVWT